MKIKIIKLTIIISLLIGLTCLFYFLGSEGSVIREGSMLITISFVLFGFILTCYVFIIGVLNKAIGTYLSEKFDEKEIKKAHNDYLKSISTGIIVVFILSVILIVLNFLANATFMKQSCFNGFEFFGIFLFLFILSCVFDFIYSIIKVCRQIFSHSHNNKTDTDT